MSGTVIVLQHVACETLGTIEGALRRFGLSPRVVRIDLGEEVPPEIGTADGLVVMGGPMSVYDHPRLPHLRDEFRLIESALKASRPILGVCLGSQLLAHVLGARVYPGQQKEIGWHEVRLSPAARQDQLWSAAPETFVGFHWHGDIFDLPSGAVSLASSALTPNQAFQAHGSAYGILFHLEVTAGHVDAMAEAFLGELEETGGTSAGLSLGLGSHLAALTDIGQGVFGSWAQLARLAAR